MANEWTKVWNATRGLYEVFREYELLGFMDEYGDVIEKVTEVPWPSVIRDVTELVTTATSLGNTVMGAWRDISKEL